MGIDPEVVEPELSDDETAAVVDELLDAYETMGKCLQRLGWLEDEEDE